MSDGPMHANVEIMRNTLFFLVAFLLVSMGIRQGLERVGFQPFLGLMSEKLDHLARNHEQVDIVFLGASDYGAAIDPVALDDAMAASGCHERSFNFGIDGLNAVEFQWLMAQLRARFPKQLPRLVIGIPSHNYDFNADRSSRTHFFMSLSNLYGYVYDIWNLPRGKMARLELLWHLFVKFGREAGQVGVLHQWLSERMGGTPGSVDRVTAGRGFLPMTGPEGDDAEMRLKEQTRQIIHDVDTQYRTDYYARLYGEANLMRMRPLIDKARRFGFEVAVLFGPSLSHYLTSTPLQRHMREAYPDLSVWQYNDPVRWPSLFDASNLVNVTHVNQKGAHAFARVLAPDLCAWIQGQRISRTFGAAWRHS
ncbi:MAG: hypothetical protein HQM01_03335 [Magnetococcales bacterium]|nr:hypothetical protein [Magnetococcales bacterium]